MGASVALRRIGGRREETSAWSFAPGTDGFTNVHHAAFAGNVGLLRRLVAAGADVDVRSQHPRGCSGATPLHLAVASPSLGAASFLLRAGADPSVRDDAGWTPLHLAADRGLVEMVRLLLQARALIDVWVGDVTPFDLARRGRHAAVVGLLRQVGAR